MTTNASQSNHQLDRVIFFMTQELAQNAKLIENI